jgi:sugar phosphate isomerase/epimerase
MEILFFCTRWGSEKLSWDAFIDQLKETGYNGIELGIPADMPTREMEMVWNIAALHHLPIIIQHYDTNDTDRIQHREKYSAWLEKIKPFPAYCINSQTGKDFFSFDENRILIDLATEFEISTGIPVYHETHRSKFSYAAHISRYYMESIPSLKLSLDMSHWVCVAESYLQNQQETMELAVQHTEHIHARIGHTQGSQVPNPADPEWQEALEAHLYWWDKVIARKKSIRQQTASFTPEFGPAPYMLDVPFTHQPICDQWEANRFMLDLLKKRYKG